MAVTFVQENAVGSPGGATTRVFTLPAAPTTGNLLIFTLAGDKNTGALTLTGFTQIFQLLATDVSLYYYWKISDGTETTINPTWATSSASGSFGRYAEYNDPAVTAGTWQISGQASTTTSGANVTSQTTGTTGTITADGLAIAAMAIDSANSVVAGTTAWTNSYNSVWVTPSTFGGGATGGALHMADKQVTAGGTTNSTWSYTASDINRDQVSGAVVVFSKVSEDKAKESRAYAAAHAHAVTGFAFAPGSLSAAAAHASTTYTKNVTAATHTQAGPHAWAVVGHTAAVEARADAGGHAVPILTAGPNDKAKDARSYLGATAWAVVTKTTPIPAPPDRVYVVPGEDRMYVVPAEEADVSQPPRNRWDKDPNDRLRYGWDWGADWLGVGETITDSVITTEPGITLVGTNSDTTTVTVQLEGGDAGETYTIANKITTSDGNIVERDIHITVRER